MNLTQVERYLYSKAQTLSDSIRQPNRIGFCGIMGRELSGHILRKENLA